MWLRRILRRNEADPIAVSALGEITLHADPAMTRCNWTTSKASFYVGTDDEYVANIWTLWGSRQGWTEPRPLWRGTIEDPESE